MSEQQKPLSLVIDYRGDEPRVVIDGTNYAWNIAKGTRVEYATITADGALVNPQARVTVTFIVDDLRILSRDAADDDGSRGHSFDTSVTCGGAL